MRKRLVRINWLILCIAVLVLLIISVVIVSHYNYNNSKRELQNYLTFASVIYDGNNALEVANAIKELDKDIRITFISLDGEVLVDSASNQEFESHIDRPEILNLGKSKLVIDYFKIIPTPENRFLGYIPIMSGCNNFCTYCVVPYTRGEEYSRPFGEIIEEAESLVKKGAKEIWLIGQNVSSYRDGKSGLAEVIKEINNLPGDFWIGFLSSHPKDLNENILTTVRESEKAMEYINLPVQSGDDFILRKMNRPYTISEYKRSVATIMEILPEATLSTDIIVGFPNEDQRAFGNTVRLMEDLKFDMAYISKYAPRAGTNSFVMKNNVAESEKIERQKILTKILELSALERNKEMEGGNEVVIVQEKKRGFLFGKTKKYKTVKFKGPESMIGSFVKVKIKKALPWRLEAEISQK